ncbi:ATP-binding protein [Novispirillum sp. DQ9]|uniref:ATP-binding protein n=1 Tax=Novispirillum sp. DQ9 TaxID=3398612 RepID=UPI003C7B25D2
MRAPISRWHLALLAGFLAIYLPFDWLTFIPSRPSINVTPWNPPAGLYVALLLIVGPRALPAVGLALVAGDLLVRGFPASTAALLASNAVILAGYGGLALALRRPGVFDPALGRVRDVAVLLGGTFVAAVPVAAGFVGVFVLDGVLAPQDMPLLAFQYWIGDAIGVGVVAPAVLLLALRPGLPRPDMRMAVQATALVAALGAIFVPVGSGQFNLFYILFLPLVWVAVSHGLGGAVTATVFLQGGLMAGLVFIGLPLDTIIYHQTLMLALTITALFLGAVVSERRQAEKSLRDQQNQLALISRLAVTGEMASALAHELNQPLLASIAYARAAQRLLGQPGDGPSGDAGRARDLIDKAVAQAERAGEVIRGLRTFLRNAPPDIRPVAPRDIIAETTALARADAAYWSVVLRTEVPERLPEVLADRVQIEQILLNLIHNSVESIAAAGSPRREILVRAFTDEPNGVVFEVEDSGPGVVPDMVPRLYSPFATTKPAGMGLGLPICRSITEAHGGRLWLDETFAGGARFRLRLPQASPATGRPS